MAVSILTEKTIQRAKPRDTLYRLRCGSVKGLHVAVNNRGGKAFALSYTSPETGSRRTLTLGRYPDMRLEQARSEAHRLRGLINQKIDPAEDKERSRTAEFQAQATDTTITVERLFQTYQADMRRRKVAAETRKIIARVYDKDIGPVIGHMPAHAVTDQDVMTILNTIAARGSYGMADKTRTYIKTAFTLGMRAHNIPGLNSPDFQLVGNPVDRVPSFYHSVVGDRHLSIEEIKRFWSEAGVTCLHPDVTLFIKLSVTLGGQRVKELLEAEWSEFDIDNRLWTLPHMRWKIRAKSAHRQPHIIPLTDFSIGLLKALRKCHKSKYLFPDQARTGPRSINSIHQAILRFCNPAKGANREPFDSFTPRDLRRTWKTLAGSIGIDLETRNRVQGHSFDGVASKHYDRYDYLTEKRQAIETFNSWIESQVGES